MKLSLKQTFILFLVILCFGHIHQGTLAVDAIRYARISLEIVQTGSLALFDHYSETPYFNKPPLLFWITAAAIKTFGFSTFIAKFPAVLFTFLGLVTVFLIGARGRADGGVVGVIAALTLIVSPNFTRNMLELSFEGMVTLGTALWLSGLIAWSERRYLASTGALFVACILIAQSKPPYFGLLLPAAVPFIVNLWGMSKSPLFGLVGGIFVGGSWYLFQGGEYIQGFAANQVGVTLTHRYPYYENLIRWLVSIVKNYALVAVPGGYFIWRNLGNWRNLGRFEQILIAHAMIIVPVVLFIAIRPRYAIVPMVALAPLAAVQILGWFAGLSEYRVRNALLSIIAVVVIIIVSGAKLHRSHEFVEYLRGNPTEPVGVLFCQGGPTAERAAGKARMNALLLELEFGKKYEVYSAYLPLPSHDGKVVFKDRSCREYQELSGAATSVVSGGAEKELDFED